MATKRGKITRPCKKDMQKCKHGNLCVEGSRWLSNEREAKLGFELSPDFCYLFAILKATLYKKKMGTL